MLEETIKLSEAKLKPCPFCGGDNVGVFSWPSSAREVMNSVHCYDCHFGLNAEKTKEAAIEAWNTRKPMDRIVEQLEYALNNCIPRVNGKDCNRREKTAYEMALEYAIEIVKNGGKNE